MKKCTCCGEVKEETEFYTNKRLRDGLNSSCKFCDLAKIKDRRKHYQINNLSSYDTSIIKICPGCKESKYIIDFSKDKTTKDGYSCYCKLCTSIYDKKLYKKVQKSNLNVPNNSTTKICSVCKIEKSLIYFHRSRSKRDGFINICKDCISAKNKRHIIKEGVSKTGKKRRENETFRVKHNNAGWIVSLVKWDKLDHPTKFICAMDGCTNQALEYHHLKYDSRSTEDPISIISPLCKDCHTLFHIREREGIDLTKKILTQIELEYTPYKSPHIKFIGEK